LAAFVLLGGKAGWPPRRVDRLAVRLGYVGEFWEGWLGSVVRYGAGRTAWGLAAVFGVGLVSGVFGVGGGWALVPVFNLVMGLPLKVAVACSEATIALGDAAAATYLSAGFRLFGFDAGGDCAGGFSWGAGCGGDRAAGGFASRRGYAVTCGRLYGGVLWTVAAAGVFLSVVGAAGSAGFCFGACSRRRLGGVVV